MSGCLSRRAELLPAKPREASRRADGRRLTRLPFWRWALLHNQTSRGRACKAPVRSREGDCVGSRAGANR
jgi:hypothetical protein